MLSWWMQTKAALIVNNLINFLFNKTVCYSTHYITDDEDSGFIDCVWIQGKRSLFDSWEDFMNAKRIIIYTRAENE